MALISMQFSPEIEVGAPPVGNCFWTDLVACAENCGGLLEKPYAEVFKSGQPAVPYRPYSRACPPPPPPPATKRWTTKKVCGTATTTVTIIQVQGAGHETTPAFLVSTHYYIAGYVDTTTSAVVSTYSGAIETTVPFCTTVTVYE